MSSKLIKLSLLMMTLLPGSLLPRNVLLEFKGAAFIATGSRFKDIYGRAAALYGPEITFQLCDNNPHWYGFASIDYLSKKGTSLGIPVSTKISLLPIAIGVKYFVDNCFDNADLYVGLGFQPVRVKIRNDSPFVTNTNKWAFGGIVKGGSYIYFCDDFFLDLFVSYSFANVSSHRTISLTGPIVPLKAHISGAILGAGLGYRF